MFAKEELLKDFMGMRNYQIYLSTLKYEKSLGPGSKYYKPPKQSVRKTPDLTISQGRGISDSNFLNMKIIPYRDRSEAWKEQRTAEGKQMLDKIGDVGLKIMSNLWGTRGL